MKYISFFLVLSGLMLLSAGSVNAQRKAERTSDKETAGNKGDRVDTRTRKMRQSNKEMGENSGTIAVKNANMRKYQGTTSSGNIRVASQVDNRRTAKLAANNTGDIRVDFSNQRKMNKAIADNTGSIDMKAVNDARAESRKTQKKIANNEGDIGGNYLARREAMRHKKGKEIASSSGDILVRTLNQRARQIRKKNKDIANYKGDIIVTKRKKGMHPSAVYRGGKVKNSYTAKERYRKRMMKRMRRQKGVEDANYMKQKMQKPKHNKNEAEIWY